MSFSCKLIGLCSTECKHDHLTLRINSAAISEILVCFYYLTHYFFTICFLIVYVLCYLTLYTLISILKCKYIFIKKAFLCYSFASLYLTMTSKLRMCTYLKHVIRINDYFNIERKTDFMFYVIVEIHYI